MALRPPVIWTLDEWNALNFPPQEFVISPWLPSPGLAMIAGQAGIGKTFFSLASGLAIASGGTVLQFPAPVARKVLYVDGEMNARDVRNRVQALALGTFGMISGGSDETSGLLRQNFRYLHYAAQPRGIPDLATDDGQDWLEDALGDDEVLFLDNLSSLVRTGVENDAESWVTIQDWLVYMRGQGKSVVLVHHTGKPDPQTGHVTQRGTSKRADVLDTIILVKARQHRKHGFQLAVTTDQGGKHRGFVPWEPNIQVGIDWTEAALPTDPCRLVAVAPGESLNNPIFRLTAGLADGAMVL